jgi:hypothetical protein
MTIQVLAGDSRLYLTLDLLGKGETAQVFSACPQEQNPTDPQWVIKLAKSQQFNLYVEREYDTVKRLRQAMLNLPSSEARWSFPLPTVQLGATADGHKALIMQPLLRHSLLNTFEKLNNPLQREKLALMAARQYTILLQALVQANLSCLDRKLRDLWWIGSPDAGHLIVTDWNVIEENPEQLKDLRRFGLLWFELLIGRQMPRNFQPTRSNFYHIQHRVSYGLWYVIARALGNSMGPQFDPLQELSATLDRLADFYQQQPTDLTKQAKINFEIAHAQGDRARLDLARMQIDIAQRLKAQANS